jgi:rod shape determining protein RodA
MTYLENTVKHTPSGLRKVLYLNWALVILLMSVAGIGFLMLYSVAGGSFSPWAEPQAKRFALGLVLMLGIAMAPIWFWRNIAVVAFLGSIVLLVAVEFFGAIGMGAKRWVDLGFIRLQPSELTKVTLVMILAAYYDWLPMSRVSRPLWVLLPVGIILLPVLLVLRQPDLGTALMLLAGGGILMFIAGVHWIYFAVVILAMIALVTLVLQSRGTDWQLLAITSFVGSTRFSTPRVIRWAQAITSPNPRLRSAPAAGPERVSCKAPSHGSISCPKSTPTSSSPRWPKSSVFWGLFPCWLSTPSSFSSASPPPSAPGTASPRCSS